MSKASSSRLPGCQGSTAAGSRGGAGSGVPPARVAGSWGRWTRRLMSMALSALVMGGFDVPEDDPGVAAGLSDGDIDGSPLPGVRLVEQPSRAMEQTKTATAKPPLKFSVSLRI